LNQFLPEWLILILLVFLLAFTAHCTYKKAWEVRLAEDKKKMEYIPIQEIDREVDRLIDAYAEAKTAKEKTPLRSSAVLAEIITMVALYFSCFLYLLHVIETIIILRRVKHKSMWKPFSFCPPLGF
jgi:hypothetical protein